MGRKGGHGGSPLPVLLLNGFVELVADFSAQVLGDADRLQRLGAVGAPLVGDVKQTLKLPHDGCRVLWNSGCFAGVVKHYAGSQSYRPLTASASPWYLGDVAWELENPLPCAQGVKAKGSLGVWPVSDAVGKILENASACVWRF